MVESSDALAGWAVRILFFSAFTAGDYPIACEFPESLDMASDRPFMWKNLTTIPLYVIPFHALGIHSAEAAGLSAAFAFARWGILSIRRTYRWWPKWLITWDASTPRRLSKNILGYISDRMKAS